MSELRLKPSEGADCVEFWGFSLPQKGSSKCKGPVQKEAQAVCEKHQMSERGPRQRSLTGHGQQHELCTRCSDEWTELRWATMSSHVLPTCHMLLILPGKSCVLYLPGQLLHKFRIQIRYHLFCQHSLIWAHLSDGIYAQWDHCLLTPLSLTLNCGLIEVRNHARFTSLPASGKGPGISRHSNTCWTHLFTHSTNVCWASVSCPLF